MSRQMPVLTSVETNSFVLSEEQTAILNMGTTVENAALQIETTCKRECALGSRACNLSVRLVDGGHSEQIDVKATCSDCPNPAAAQIAVDSLVDYADRRIDALSGVEPKISDTAVSRTPEQDDPFFDFVHEISDPEMGDFHGISIEALRLLPVVSEGSHVPKRVINVLARAGFAGKGDYPRFLVDVRKLETKIDTEYPFLIVAEGMNVLMEDSSVEAYPNMGNSSIALLQQARQKVLEQRIPQRKRLKDTEIEELGVGVRAYNRLKRADIQTLAELTSWTEEQLGNIENMADKQLEEIEERLRALGLRLRPSPEE